MDHPLAAISVKISDRPIYCMGVRGALSPGNWVLFKSPASTVEGPEIGWIIATGDDGDTLEVNVFRRVTPELTRELHLPKTNNPLLTHIPRIVRTPAREYIDMMQVKSICWVFQRSYLNAFPHEGHQGMKNLFLLECNEQGGGAFMHGCHPFCSRHPHYDIFAVECYQERVWKGLQIIRSEIARHLGRYSEKQGSFTRVSSQVVVGGEAWQYLRCQVESCIRSPTECTAKVARRVLEPGLLLKAHQACLSAQILRFETEDELRALSSVLGELVTVDVRKRRPRYDTSESLFVNDVCNVVAGSDAREEPFVTRTVQQGIDLVYDGTKVRIRIRYQRYQYRLPLASPSTILNRAILRKRPLGPGEQDDSSSSDDDDDDDSLYLPLGDEASIVVVGRQFERLGRVYEVTRLNIDGVLTRRNMEGATITAKVVWPASSQVEVFAFDDTLRWIRHRLAQENAGLIG
jgi:hypothetical protein